MSPEEVREYVLRWQRAEVAYRVGKFEPAYNRRLLVDEGFRPGTVWWDQIVGKLQRAHVLGAQTVNGRQALAKCASATLAIVEAAVGEYGLLPTPGAPSGKNLQTLMRP